jgi:hypothetical protein
MGAGEKKERTNRFFSLTSGVVGNFFQLHKDLELVEYLLSYSMKTTELGLAPPFFGADPRWSCWSWLCLADKFWSGVGFLDLELCGALPNTP